MLKLPAVTINQKQTHKSELLRVWRKIFNLVNTNLKKEIKKEEMEKGMEGQSDFSILFLFQVNHFN